MAAEDTVPFDSPISKLTGQDEPSGAFGSGQRNKDPWAYNGFDRKQAERDSNAKRKSILGLSPFDILNKRRTKFTPAKSLPMMGINMPPSAEELAEERQIRELLAAAEPASVASESDILPQSSVEYIQNLLNTPGADSGAIPAEVYDALLSELDKREAEGVAKLTQGRAGDALPGDKLFFSSPSDVEDKSMSTVSAPEGDGEVSDGNQGEEPAPSEKDTGNPYLSYGGLGALGALTGALVDKKNRLRGGGVGLLSALLANYAYRKLRYGSDVTL